MTSAAHANDPQVFHGLFDAYPDGVLLVDKQGRIVLANAAAASVLGYSVAELENLPVDALVPDAVAPRHAAYRRGYTHAPRARPMGTDLELMARRADGSEVMVEIALSPLRVGEVDYVVASVRGIGAYPRVKRAMQRAHYSEALVQLGRIAVDTLDPDELLQRAPAVAREALEMQAAAVFLLTPNQLELRAASHSGVQTDTADRMAYANQPDTIAGYVVAQRAPVVVDDFASERRFNVPARLLAAGARCGMAVPLIDRGKVIGVLGAWSQHPRPFGDDELAFMQSLATLLSTSLLRNQAEAQARHVQRLETVGQLTGGVAHDFNNLLTVIQGNLQLLEDQPSVRNDALSRQLVAAAARAGQRGADLTGKLLAFARRQALEPSAVDPVVLLHSLADMLRRTLGENIHVTVHAPRKLPRCLADEVQLESALLNVAINARDAMPRGGTLALRCGSGAPPEIESPSTGPGGLGDGPDDDDRDEQQGPAQWVWFSLQDNGSGMSAEVRERAFEPFFTTKDAGRGTGLGLSTVYGFVKQSQGHVQLDSAPGLGTTLTIYLPAHDAGEGDDEALDAPAAPAVVPPGLRVLLVEDDAEVRQIAQAFLRSMACEVVACDSGEGALAALAQERGFELLFSDIMLGAGIDGHELARQVEAAFPALAVLLTSGYAHHRHQGADAIVPLRWPVLGKPYTRQALAQAIAACLAHGGA